MKTINICVSFTAKESDYINCIVDFSIVFFPSLFYHLIYSKILRQTSIINTYQNPPCFSYISHCSSKPSGDNRLVYITYCFFHTIYMHAYSETDTIAYDTAVGMSSRHQPISRRLRVAHLATSQPRCRTLLYPSHYRRACAYFFFNTLRS